MGDPGQRRDSCVPSARAVPGLSGRPHGCWSLLQDNPWLLLIRLLVKTLLESAFHWQSPSPGPVGWGQTSLLCPAAGSRFWFPWCLGNVLIQNLLPAQPPPLCRWAPTAGLTLGRQPGEAGVGNRDPVGDRSRPWARWAAKLGVSSREACKS